MPTTVTSLLAELNRARLMLNRVSGGQLHSDAKREGIRSLAERYFKEVRPSLISKTEQDPDIASVDSVMQEIIQLCHKHGSVKRYLDLTAVRSLVVD
jgi:hypothetical protein